jgi:tRNA-2-methylthio-N6-dimethylallyladenosine synthase
LDLVATVEFAGAYSFKYSPRPGTPAADLEQVPDPVKAERLKALQDILDNQRDAFNSRALGHTNAVLLERPGRHFGQLVGRTPYNQAIYVDADPDQLGSIVDVKITGISPNSLTGKITSPNVVPVANDFIAARDHL